MARIREGRADSRGPGDIGDIDATAGLLNADLEVLRQVGTEEIVPFTVRDGAVEVHSDATTLAHIAETMARKVITPQIAEELNCSPVHGEDANDLRLLAEDLAWAIDRANELHEQANAERMAAREEAR